ncbi:MAG: type II toxin-antitoxin system HicB family antitoxin [Methanosarcinales archaeon]|nr:type II toxin-antitoxin system HicB family antitoxin [Methanosarcinales archaeon]
MDIISFPVLISKEGKWFVACCPMLDIATQGRTEEEVKENMADLIEEYMEDPDTQKPDWDTIMSTSVTMTSVPVKIRGVYRDTKTSPTTTA